MVGEISKDVAIPNTIFMMVDNEFSEWFLNIIAREDFSQLIFSQGSFNVIMLQNDILSGFVDRNPNSKELLDPLLTIGLLFFNKILYQ